jgi:O-antigen/teichoic acid export membrane protein
LSNSALEPLVLPVSIYFLFMMVAAPLEIVMICRERYRLASTSYAASDLLRAAALVLPTILTGDLRWLILGAISFAAVRFGATLVYLRATYGRQLRPDRPLLREQLRYSLPFGLAVLVGTLQANFHHFVVSHSFDAATFAIFAVGCLQIPLIDFIATPMADVMMVKMTETQREGGAARAKAIWHQASSDLALLFFPLVGLLVVAADDLIVLLFTETYAASVPIFRVSVLTILFTPLLVESVLRVQADTRFILFLNSLQLGIIAMLIWPLIGRWGLVGGVVVTVTAITIVRAVGLARVKRLFDSGIRDLLPWPQLGRIAAIAAVATGASLGVKTVIDARPIVVLALIGITHTLVWAALSIRWGFLPMISVATVRSWIRRFALPRLSSQRAD